MKRNNQKVSGNSGGLAKVGMSRWNNWWIHLILIIAAMACIIPFLLVLSISFTDERALSMAGYGFIPAEFSTAAYEYLFKNPVSIIRGYGVTIFTAVVGTLMSLAMTSMLAYVMTRKDYPYRKFLTVFVLITMLFNAGLVPWYLVYTKVLNFKDSILGLLVPNMLVNGFNVIVMRTFFKNSIPDGLIDAACIDGAGEFRIYWNIVLPLSLPILASIGFMTVLNYWNNWYNSMVFINDENLFSIQYLMTRTLLNIQNLKTAMLMGTLSPEMAQMLAEMPTSSVRMAMAIVGVGPMLFLFPFFQKYFVSGLTTGSVKQ